MRNFPEAGTKTSEGWFEKGVNATKPNYRKSSNPKTEVIREGEIVRMVKVMLIAHKSKSTSHLLAQSGNGCLGEVGPKGIMVSG